MNQRAMRLHLTIEKWPLKAPFRITGYTFNELDVVVATLEQGGCSGRGEAAGVYYRGDSVPRMIEQIESVRGAVEAGLDRIALQALLAPGGARNALDCALWELEAQLAGRPVWELAHLDPPRPLLTTYTLGADEPDRMAAGAHGFSDARALKLKLTGAPIDIERVRAVRAARPDVWLGVDANQGYTRALLDQTLPVFVDCGVALIEQPLRVGQEAELRGLLSPIPLAADESVQSRGDIDRLADVFDLINIKLDKCGGLTEALAMVSEARRLGVDLMVGNMTGTSLAMAPAFLVGQLCQVVDLDGPLFLCNDRSPSVNYEDGAIICTEAVWGGPAMRE